MNVSAYFALLARHSSVTVMGTDATRAARPTPTPRNLNETAGRISLPCAHDAIPARRLLNYLVLLALASFLTFSLTSVLIHAAGQPAAAQPPSPAVGHRRQAAELDLDQPIPLQYYAHWAAGAIHGDFGTTVTGQPVADELGRRIGVSLRLLMIGSVLGATLGVLIGAWSAVRQYRLSIASSPRYPC